MTAPPVDRIATASARFEGASHVVSALHDLSRLMLPDLLQLEALLPTPVCSSARCAQAAHDLIRAGGKRIRPCLCLLAYRLASGAPAAASCALQLAACVEWLHTATLLHDDVIDDASERRARPCARTVWGNAVSVIAGDFLLVHAIQRLHALGSSELDALLDRTLRELIDGEVNQLEQRGCTSTEPARFELLATQKTGSLFAMACVGGAWLGGAPAPQREAWRQVAIATGLAFQLTDDLLDLCSSPEVLGKGIGQDLATGSVTLPVVEVLAQDSALRCALEQQLTRDGGAISAPLAGRILQASRQPGALDRCREMVRRYTDRAERACAQLPESPERAVLGRFIQHLAERPNQLRVSATRQELSDAS